MARRAEFDDVRDFNNLINGLGGQSLFRAWFGQFNYATLLEYSYLSLICHSNKDICVGFLSLNDSANSGDLQSFEPILECIKQLLPVKVDNFKLEN